MGRHRFACLREDLAVVVNDSGGDFRAADINSENGKRWSVVHRSRAIAETSLFVGPAQVGCTEEEQGLSLKDVANAKLLITQACRRKLKVCKKFDTLYQNFESKWLLGKVDGRNWPA